MKAILDATSTYARCHVSWGMSNSLSGHQTSTHEASTLLLYNLLRAAVCRVFCLFAVAIGFVYFHKRVGRRTSPRSSPSPSESPLPPRQST